MIRAELCQQLLHITRSQSALCAFTMVMSNWELSTTAHKDHLEVKLQLELQDRAWLSRV